MLRANKIEFSFLDVQVSSVWKDVDRESRLIWQNKEKKEKEKTDEEERQQQRDETMVEGGCKEKHKWRVRNE